MADEVEEMQPGSVLSVPTSPLRLLPMLAQDPGPFPYHNSVTNPALHNVIAAYFSASYLPLKISA